MRFPIRIDSIWTPFVLVGGATRGNSYVEVEDGEIGLYYGLLFRHKVPLEDVESVGRRQWPFWMGIGWRTNFTDLVGLIGSYDGVVELKLRNRKKYWAVLGATRIAVSLEDPEGFIEALEKARVGGKKAEAKPKSKPRARRKKVSESE